MAKHHARPAYTSMGRTLRYADLDRMGADLAAWLQQAAGLSKGDRLAIMLPNVLQYPVSLVAAFRAGLTVVNTNPLYTPRELKDQLADSGARAIVILENFAPRSRGGDRGHGDRDTVIVTGAGDLLGFPKSAQARISSCVTSADRFRNGACPMRCASTWRCRRGATRTACRPSSGPRTSPSCNTRAAPRASPRERCSPTVISSRTSCSSRAGSRRRSRDAEDPTIVGALPLYHVFALTQALFFLYIGGRNVLIANPRDFPAFVADLRRNRFTFFSGVNTLFNALLNTPGFADLDFSHLRVSLGGGMAVQRAVAERWKEVTGNMLTRSVGSDRDLARRDRQSARRGRFHRLDRAAAAVHRHLDPRRRRQTAAARAVRRDLRRGPAGDAGVLEAAGRDGQGHAARSRAAHRGYRPHGFPRLRVHRRPQEGHDPRVGVQRVSERGRGRGGGASGRARGRRGRAARRARRRGGRAVRRAQGSRAHRAGADRALPRRRSPGTRCRSASIFATSCRRPTSGKYCVVRSATS